MHPISDIIHGRHKGVYDMSATAARAGYVK